MLDWLASPGVVCCVQISWGLAWWLSLLHQVLTRWKIVSCLVRPLLLLLVKLCRKYIVVLQRVTSQIALELSRPSYFWLVDFSHSEVSAHDWCRLPHVVFRLNLRIAGNHVNKPAWYLRTVINQFRLLLRYITDSTCTVSKSPSSVVESTLCRVHARGLTMDSSGLDCVALRVNVDVWLRRIRSLSAGCSHLAAHRSHQVRVL